MKTEEESFIAILTKIFGLMGRPILLIGIHFSQRYKRFTTANSIQSKPAKSVYGIHDPKGLSHLTQLRVGLSKLNFHKFKHNFRDTINPMCPTSDGIEDTEHFLLFCPSFDAQRQDLLAGMVELLRPFVQITDLSNDALTQLLLYGDQDLSYDLNKNILELTLRFIRETGRFD